MLLNRAIENAF
jgi:hypothetical protein